MITVKILCVGADAALQRVFQETLASAACQLEMVPDLAEARQRYRAEEPNLILARLGEICPVEDFTEFIREIGAAGNPIPVVVVTESDDLELRLRMLRLRVVDCLPRPLDKSRLAYLVSMLTASSRCARAAKSAPSQTPPGAAAAEDSIAASPAMNRLLEQFRAVAPLETTILLTGETGSGKTHMARLIHDLSPRRRKPFVVVQCSSLSPTLIQSELFGHARGAFTGADGEYQGMFAAAEDGTVLLDDVDCIPLESQARLLRVVENRVFEPVGSSRSRPLRARLIAATNRVLENDVTAGQFRADLYHRLNVVRFPLPPLRERPAEVRPLAEKFLEKFCGQAGRELLQFSGDAGLAVETYPWPGNIRELRNAVERAVALCTRPIIELEDLPESIQAHYRTSYWKQCPIGPASSAPANELQAARRDGELQRLLDALRRNGNNRVRAAAELGVSRVTLYRKLHQYGLN